jgi:hypothetical protein
MLETLPIDAIQPATDAATGYANLVERGIIARQAMDTGRWVLGGNVRELVTYYGERTIEQYADDVGVEADRLYEYAELATFYPMDVREELSQLDLCYTHYREAKYLKDLSLAVEFLKTIALYRWNVSQTRAALKALKQSGDIDLDRISRMGAITDLRNQPYNKRPVIEWQGTATVRFDKGGKPELQWDSIPEVEDGKKYRVSFEAIED